MVSEQRKFIRHPLSYPIKTRVLNKTGRDEFFAESENIGAGGFLFRCGRKMAPGTELEAEIKVEKRTFTLDGKVVRCSAAGHGSYNIAVTFNSPSELLKVRMMEQVVRIELFKTRLERRYKVKLEFARVAQEWIKRYSRAFANRYGG